MCSDSFSCLQTLNSSKFHFKTHHILLSIKGLLHNLYSKGYMIKFVWVPAHCNIYGNEQADLLAKLGVSCGIIFNRDIQHFEYFSNLKKYTLNNWQISWNTSDQGRYCYSICPKVKVYPWFRYFSVGRNFICTFSRLMSNHYICKCYLYRMNIIDSNICECNETYEDIDHIVFRCSRFNLPREQFFDRISSLGYDIPVSVRDILGNHNLPILKLLYQYLCGISCFV